MILSKWAVCNGKQSIFIKECEESGLLSNLGLKTPLTNSTVMSYFFLKV